MKKLSSNRTIDIHSECQAMREYLDTYWSGVPDTNLWMPIVFAHACVHKKHTYNVLTWQDKTQKEKDKRQARIEAAMPGFVAQHAGKLDYISNMLGHLHFAGFSVIDAIRKHDTKMYLFDSRLDMLMQSVKSSEEFNATDWANAQPREDKSVDMENEFPTFHGHFIPNANAFTFAEGLAYEYATGQKNRTRSYMDIVISQVYQHLCDVIEHNNAVQMGRALAALMKAYNDTLVVYNTVVNSKFPALDICLYVAQRDAMYYVTSDKEDEVQKLLTSAQHASTEARCVNFISKAESLMSRTGRLDEKDVAAYARACIDGTATATPNPSVDM